MVKITLDNHDLQLLSSEGSLDIELSTDALKALNLDELIKKGIAEHTGHASNLYKEIRKQVDEYMHTHLKTQVGNYVRCESHTADRIMRENVAEEIEKGIKHGMKYYAEKQAEKIANALSGVIK